MINREMKGGRERGKRYENTGAREGGRGEGDIGKLRGNGDEGMDTEEEMRD